MSKHLQREDFLDRLRGLSKDESELDDLDRKALEGYQYLDKDQDANAALGRLDNRFEQMMASQSADSGPTKVRSMRWIRAVAAIGLLLLIPSYFLFKTPSNEALVTAYYDAPRSTYYQQVRGGQEDTDGAITQAFELYETGSYSAAQEALANLIPEHPDKPDLKFYQGVAALAAGNSKAAVTLLTESLEINYQNVNQQAPWYLALAYLQQGNVAEARIYLEQTINADPRHQRNAEELLAKI